MADEIAQLEAETIAEKSYDASDPQAINLARKKAGRKKADRLYVIKTLLDSSEGRQWLHDLMYACDIFRPAYIRGENERDCAFRLGKQHIGSQIHADIVAVSLDSYAAMLKEAKARKGNFILPSEGLE